MNLSPGSFYHKENELTVVKFHCFSPLKAVHYVLKEAVCRHRNDGKNNSLIENTKIDGSEHK